MYNFAARLLKRLTLNPAAWQVLHGALIAWHLVLMIQRRAFQVSCATDSTYNHVDLCVLKLYYINMLLKTVSLHFLDRQFLIKARGRRRIKVQTRVRVMARVGSYGWGWS